MCRNRCAYLIDPVLAVALVTAAAWVYAFAAERHADHLMQAVYGQPTSQFGPALAASAADVHLARGR